MSLLQKLASFKTFSSRVWALSSPYFESKDKWRARALLTAIVLLNLGAVFMLVLINDWNRLFYDALQNKQADVFWTQLGRFTYLAFAFILIAVYKFYLTQLLELRWRAWMTAHYLERWLAHHAFYQLELARFTQPPGSTATPDNPDQRIQEDINLFTSYTISLSMGLLNAVVTLASFVGILWSLSGGFSFSLHGSTVEIPGFMVWMALLYCIAGSVVTHYIGRPLIRLNFEQQRYEADFRHHMVRVREYSEAIALDRGEAVERGQLDLRFSKVLGNYLSLIKTQKNLTWFTVGFGQAAVVFPFIVAAPRFFSGAIQLGELMQIASAFGRVQESLSWFVDNYDRLASWRATTDRLTSFEASMAAITHDNRALIAADSAALTTSDLTVNLPDGAVLLQQAALQAGPGDSVLLQGPSGSGKSTLFRTLAGIWPFAQGHLARPADAMFIPQHPYFPNGPLREALAYPQSPADYSDEALKQSLTQALLPQLTEQLDVVGAWSQQLSGGEQQRLALARVFLKKPTWVFADEATSALDEAAEKTLYQRLQALVSAGRGALVSIAHRPSVAIFHNQTWQLQPQPEVAAARYRIVQTRLQA
jgi:putative ATP-binding cassette transporter